MSALTRKDLAELLIQHGLIEQAAIEDAEYYDGGKTLKKVGALCEALAPSAIEPSRQPCACEIVDDQVTSPCLVHAHYADQKVREALAVPEEGRVEPLAEAMIPLRIALYEKCKGCGKRPVDFAGAKNP